MPILAASRIVFSAAWCHSKQPLRTVLNRDTVRKSSVRAMVLLTLYCIAATNSAALAQRIELNPASPCWGPSARQGTLWAILEGANTSRTRTWSYVAPSGYKICFATTNEESARPKGRQAGGPTQYFFSQKSPYYTAFTVAQGCPDGGITLSQTGAAICGLSGSCDPRSGAAAGSILGTVTNNTCGMFNGDAWFRGNAVFLLMPDGQSCPAEACQRHVMPWERFPSR
jgi:hypothetical protein